MAQSKNPNGYKEVKNGGSYVDLKCRELDDEAAKQAARALMDPNTMVELLSLSHNTIGDEGATALANALTHNSTLQHLWLRNNTIGDQGATALLDCFKSTSALQERWKLLSNSNNGYDGMIVLKACIEALEKSLKYNVTLERLDLTGNTNISQAFKDEIQSLISEENQKKRHQEKALLASLLTG